MIDTEGVAALQTGMALGVASMASLGPNNLMLIREGLTKGRVGLIATTVWTSYLVLLTAAYVLADSSDQMGPGLRAGLSWSGLAAIACFAFLALRSALRANDGCDANVIGCTAVRPRIAKAIAVVWLNPLTYLELLLIPAVLCGAFTSTIARVEFLGTLLLMAAIACYGYGFAGGMLAPLLQRRAALRVFDFMSGVLLVGITVAMAAALFSSGPSPTREAGNKAVQVGFGDRIAREGR